MPTYDKRPGGKVRARVRVEPFPIQSRTFNRKIDAQLWAEPLEAELKRKKQAGLSDEDRYTFGDLIEDYVKHKTPDRKSDLNALNRYARWWHREIGDKALSEVSTVDIGRLRDKLASEPVERVDINGRPIGRTDPKTLSANLKGAATVNRYLSALSAMCRYNMNERGWLRANPVTNLEKKREPRERVRFLAEEERRVLLAACQGSDNPHLYPIVMVALTTGARKGEVLNLTMADIDPDFTRANLWETKNGDARTLHITPTLRRCLMDHYAWLDGFYEKTGYETNWLFPRADGRAPIDIRKAWQTARDRAVEDCPSLSDFRFHDLRHTFASYLAMSGATLVELMHALGHRSLKAVQRYAHLTEDHTRDVVLRMERQRFRGNDVANDNGDVPTGTAIKERRSR